ncbi:MAG: AAA family ATPase, partial [Muribaculaceae bacterium]|nr:AAA family ATPase [Muribaculaceae bacterium]
MTPLRRFPAGVQDFEKIRTDGFVYVDKTEYIYELANNFGDALFLSRPRRFGKSLLCSTLKYYFQGCKDLFEGLAMERLETEWTQYPVFHFDMSRCKNDDPAYVEISLNSILSDFEKEYGVSNEDLSFGGRLEKLIITAHRRTGHRAVLIFDEYDSPVLNVIDSAEKMNAVRSVFNSFYGPVKSMAEHLRFVFITGVTKFSQMSIFSTINNLTNISMIEKWEPLCGITAQELEENFEEDISRLAVKYKVTPGQMLQMLRDRYDGYHFGQDMIDVYNPFSIVNAFSSMELDDYWFSSGTPAALIKILDMYNFQLGDIENTQLFKSDFDQPFDNMSSAIPILYQSGYLTIKDYNYEENIYTLGIPNQEVHSGFYRALMPRYLTNNEADNRSLLMAVKRAMIADDIDAALRAAQSYLSALPYELSNKTERDFETLLRVMFDCIGIETQTEVRSARGRCDVVLKSRRTIYVLELKISSTATVEDALAQIDEKNYLIPYWNDPRRKVKVGVTVNPDTRTIEQWKVA